MKTSTTKQDAALIDIAKISKMVANLKISDEFQKLM